MSKSIIGTFNVKTPDELAKDRLICEKRKAAKEAAALKRKAAMEKAEALRLAKIKKEHRSYVIRMAIFISICVVIGILLMKLNDYLCGDSPILSVIFYVFAFALFGPSLRVLFKSLKL